MTQNILNLFSYSQVLRESIDLGQVETLSEDTAEDNMELETIVIDDTDEEEAHDATADSYPDMTRIDVTADLYPDMTRIDDTADSYPDMTRIDDTDDDSSAQAPLMWGGNTLEETIDLTDSPCRQPSNDDVEEDMTASALDTTINLASSLKCPVCLDSFKDLSKEGNFDIILNLMILQCC